MSKIEKPSTLGIEVTRLDEGEIRVKLPDPQFLLGFFGTEDEALARTLLAQSLTACGASSNPQTTQCREFMLASIGDLKPRDSVERMLSLQMAATHISLMSASQKMNDAESLQRFEIYERAFNRLARTFAAQVEALRKHRNGGQSKVTVEHVTVNEGGKAIVGSVAKGAGVRSKLTLTP